MNRSDFSKPFFMSAPAEGDWDKPQGPPGGGGPMNRFKQQERWNRYSEAYGDYQGGYGQGFPPGPYGPPRPMMGPPSMRGPPPMGGPLRGPMMGPSGPRPFRPPYPYRNAPGPIRPLNPIRFLEKCGAKPENIKDLPKEMLRLFMATHCGVCNMDFDTFSFARLHYLSKNHLKNQRKWLMTASGSNANKQEPLKSRDLYCELCDVQITSKAHADSHYAGKAHHAVVLGRRQPKNIKLLDPGAQARLEQLKRREKKFVKVEPSEVKEVKLKEKVASELYCDICKTGMSCSEQMTAHLNGKRHLSKEKQHILRMVKTPEDEKATGADVKEAGSNGNDSANGQTSDEKAELDVDNVIGEAAAIMEEVVNAEAASAEEPMDDSWVHGTGAGWDQPQGATGV